MGRRGNGPISSQRDGGLPVKAGRSIDFDLVDWKGTDTGNRTPRKRRLAGSGLLGQSGRYAGRVLQVETLPKRFHWLGNPVKLLEVGWNNHQADKGKMKEVPTQNPLSAGH
ncbi:hypothetical protein GCM10022402_46970 [Salinactinospora qingdaonensis]|uniref:Uncharacterized protein n=1 Tax=Salinactinospora qingdaonensis TaxID=702744 RepID=A0ABP7GG84_9ACTN